MAFSIQQVAKDYIYRRFPKASVVEKEKYVDDWTHKIKVSKALVKDFSRRVGDPKDKRVLDVGCGNGGISIAFALAGAQVSGVEIEQELYEIAKDHAASLGVSLNLVLYDGNILPFSDNFFDYAVSTSVLEHTDDPVAYLQQILRVVKPGGRLYLGFPNKLQFVETHTQLLFLTYIPSVLRPLYIKLFHRNPLEDNNLHFYGYFDLQRMLRKIKAQNTEYYWGLIPEAGSTKSVLKKTVKKILAMMGVPYKVFLSQILVIVEKKQLHEQSR